jgi:hypothetical protein
VVNAGGSSILELRGFSKKFRDFVAVENLSFKNQFEAWLNLTRDSVEWEPIVRFARVSLLWAAVFLAAAWAAFVRRDVLS